MFRDWIDHGRSSLVVGGHLLAELDRHGAFREWRKTAVLSGALQEVDHASVDERTKALLESGECRSNDAHVIALAQVSGARLLYADERDLERDFKDKALIDSGVLYPIKQGARTDVHRRRTLRHAFCASD